MPSSERTNFAKNITKELLQIQEKIQPLLTTKNKNFSADITISKQGLILKLKSNPVDQKVKVYTDLVVNLSQFPRTENHDLLALDKTKFIEFIKTKYGGFPQMAEERGLDLNNIYRVNRKFKNMPFIVFKYETIMEIIGTYDKSEVQHQTGELLAQERTIQQVIKKLS